MRRGGALVVGLVVEFEAPHPATSGIASTAAIARATRVGRRDPDMFRLYLRSGTGISATAAAEPIVAILVA